jgi:hypothetical protein
MRTEKEINNRIREIEQVQHILKNFEPHIDSLQLHARKWELCWALGKTIDDHGFISPSSIKGETKQ